MLLLRWCLVFGGVIASEICRRELAAQPVLAAQRLQGAIRGVYARGEVLTPDIGGKASSEQFAEAVVGAVKSS